MKGGRLARVALALGALGVACREAEPPPPAATRSPEAEAKALIEQARRELAEAPPVAARGTPLYVPAGTRGARLPLLVFLHGLGGSGQDLKEGLHLAEMADAFDFAFMAPEGTLDRSGRRFWNAGESCCNFDGLAIDHVAALRQWIGEATAATGVDPRRVYLVGFSNGGFMAYRAACELGALLAGIVSIAGAGPGNGFACHPDRPLSVLEIHGDRDPIVKFDGGHLFADARRPRYPSVRDSLAFWAKADHCTGEAAAAESLDLHPGLPGAETLVSRYPGCSGRRVESWTIGGGDHSAGLSRFSLKAIMDFIATDRPSETAAPH